MTSKHIEQFWDMVEIFDHARSTSDEAAFITLVRICRDYADKHAYPAITSGEMRDNWFLERLKKFRIRFYEDI